jgi:hypothetical protein
MISRRKFVQGLAIGGAVSSFAPALLAGEIAPLELTGTEFDLELVGDS